MTGKIDGTVYLKTAACTGTPFTDGNRILDNDTALNTAASLTFSISRGINELHGWVRQSAWQNASWEDGGTATLDLYFDTTDANIDVRARIVSLNSSNTVLQSGSWTGWQTASTDLTFSITAPTWTHTEAATNRVAVEIELTNTAAHGGALSVAIGCANSGGSTNSKCTIPITHYADSVYPKFEQKDFRFRNDNGSESAATWRQSINVDDSMNLDSDVQFRLRFNIQNDGNTVATSSRVLDLAFEYNLNSAGWNSITASSSVIDSEFSSYYIDGLVDCVQRLGSGTFESNNNGMDENGAVSTGLITWNNADELEVETCLRVKSADTSNGDTLEIRVIGTIADLAAGTVGCAEAVPQYQVETYTQVPSISISKTVAGARRIFITAMN
jgi:hypothetical protein